MIAFTLSMPGVGSWNGRWTGEGRPYVLVHSSRRSPESITREAEIVAGSPYHYSFGDGWAASVSARMVEPDEARKLRKHTAGFCGYDWMCAEIIEHGRILTLVERYPSDPPVTRKPDEQLMREAGAAADNHDLQRLK